MAELAKQTNGCLSLAITAQSRVAHSVFVSRLHCFSWSQHWIINIYILIRSSDVDININFFFFEGVDIEGLVFDELVYVVLSSLVLIGDLKDESDAQQRLLCLTIRYHL